MNTSPDEIGPAEVAEICEALRGHFGDRCRFMLIVSTPTGIVGVSTDSSGADALTMINRAKAMIEEANEAVPIPGNERKH